MAWGSRLGPMHLRLEVGNLLAVPGANVHQIGVGSVGHLGSGSNELVTVVDQGSQVGEQLDPVGASPASLPERQRGWHLPDVLPGMKEHLRQGRAVAKRTFDPDHAARIAFPNPPQDSPVCQRSSLAETCGFRVTSGRSRELSPMLRARWGIHSPAASDMQSRPVSSARTRRRRFVCQVFCSPRPRPSWGR
jgi:hypothetical protein